MGTVYYGAADTSVTIEDRALAHLKLVISSKLRRGESFTVSWAHPPAEARGRTTLWLHPMIPLRFVFDDAAPASIDRAWIAELEEAAFRTGGIVLGPESVDAAPRGGRQCRDDEIDGWHSTS